MRTRILAAVLGLPLVAAFTLTQVPAAAQGGDAEVTVGSTNPFSGNK